MSGEIVARMRTRGNRALTQLVGPAARALSPDRLLWEYAQDCLESFCLSWGRLRWFVKGSTLECAKDCDRPPFWTA